MSDEPDIIPGMAIIPAAVSPGIRTSGLPDCGHGHVYPAPLKARCGGPDICAMCAIDRKALHDARAAQLEQSFADVPVSLNEIRAERSENSAEWTPRDMLIALLRDIDNGTRNVTDAVVTFSTDNGEGYSFFNATKDKAVAVFLLERAKHRMMEGK